MKFRSSLITLALPLLVVANPVAMAQKFMSEQQMLDTFSGATLSGIPSVSYTEARWTQVYEQFEEGQTEGDITGEQGGSPYTAKWFIKNGKWCENWGGGNGCYDLVLVDEKTIKAYENGTPLKNVWEIQ